MSDDILHPTVHEDREMQVGNNVAPGASYLWKYQVRLDKVRRLLIRFCVNNGRILDVGCGDGLTTIFLMDKLPMRIYGLEVDERCAHEANRHFACRVCDCGRDTFPFNDKFFDIVHAGEVVEHVLDTDHLIAESRRTLKDDGSSSFPLRIWLAG